MAIDKSMISQHVSTYFTLLYFTSFIRFQADSINGRTLLAMIDQRSLVLQMASTPDCPFYFIHIMFFVPLPADLTMLQVTEDWGPTVIITKANP